MARSLPEEGVDDDEIIGFGAIQDGLLRDAPKLNFLAEAEAKKSETVGRIVFSPM